jgi:hypothetical protein
MMGSLRALMRGSTDAAGEISGAFGVASDPLGSVVHVRLTMNRTGHWTVEVRAGIDTAGLARSPEKSSHAGYMRFGS